MITLADMDRSGKVESGQRYISTGFLSHAGPYELRGAADSTRWLLRRERSGAASIAGRRFPEFLYTGSDVSPESLVLLS